ncbi:MAG: cohesin domain-containing protein [Anaerolineae bacterium]
MRTKISIALVMALLLTTVLLTATASAALPAGLSWVKYSGNPVVTGSICGLGSAMRPSIVFESANNYKMYFTTVPGNGTQIYLATTTDGGATWTCANGGSAVLPHGGAGAFDEVRAMTPTVIKDAGAYKMWYAGRNAASVYAIGYATSPDGITWTKNPTAVLQVGSPSTWDSQYVREPSVVKIGSTYHMWYSGTAQWPYFRIGHATSTDAINWTKDSANPVLVPTAGGWDANETYSPSVVMNGSVFEMFYSGNSNGQWMTGHASSNDGVTWTKDTNPILANSGTGWENSDSLDYVGAVLDGSTWKVFYSADGYKIGMATLQNSAQLAITPLSRTINTGQQTTVTIDLTDITNLYGYQFEVTYDQTKLSATGAFVNTFFDTTTNAFPVWSGDCTSTPGVCKFSVSRQGGSAVSGSGTLAQITFTGTAAGLVPIGITNDILADKDAGVLAHTTVGGYVQVNATATVSGVVSLQGRSIPLTAGSVTLYDESGYVGPTTTNFDPTTGAWSATVPVQGGGTTYDIVASHSLYLSNIKSGVAVTAGGNYPQASTKLLGGDATNDGTVEIGDLSCIGGRFGLTPTTCGTNGSNDINGDGTVNILDLVLAGGNYNLSSTQPW